MSWAPPKGVVRSPRGLRNNSGGCLSLRLCPSSLYVRTAGLAPALRRARTAGCGVRSRTNASRNPQPRGVESKGLFAVNHRRKGASCAGEGRQFLGYRPVLANSLRAYGLDAASFRWTKANTTRTARHCGQGTPARVSAQRQVVRGWARVGSREDFLPREAKIAPGEKSFRARGRAPRSPIWASGSRGPLLEADPGGQPGVEFFSRRAPAAS